jgi:hypothetical protein
MNMPLHGVHPRGQHAGDGADDGGELHAAPRQAELLRLLHAVHQVVAGHGEAEHLGAARARLQQEGGEVGGRGEGVDGGAEHPPARRLDGAGGVALDGVAEGVVGVTKYQASPPMRVSPAPEVLAKHQVS